MVGCISTLQVVVFYTVSVSAESADYDITFDVTVGGLVTETMAAGTLFDD